MNIQHQPRTGQCGGAQRLDGEGALHVAQTLRARECALRRRVAYPQQQASVDLSRGQCTRELMRLVEAALAQALRRQRHGQHPMGLLQRGLDPWRTAQQRGKARGPARLGAELEADNQPGPGVFIGQRRHAGVERRRRAHAGTALRDRPFDRQRTGPATQPGLGETDHAVLAHRLCRPSTADRALAGYAVGYALQQCTPHRSNIPLAPPEPIAMTDQRPPTIDPVAALRWACQLPSESPWLHEEVASRISPALSGVFSLRTTVGSCLPSGAGFGTNSMRTVVAAGTVTDFSLEKKSSWPIVPTEVFEVGDHAPMECGCFLA